jgi:hypothetical protein
MRTGRPVRAAGRCARRRAKWHWRGRSGCPRRRVCLATLRTLQGWQ